MALGRKKEEVHYDIELDSEHQDELLRSINGNLKHNEDTYDATMGAYKKIMYIAGGALIVRLFWEPISEAAVAGTHKATDFVRTRVFKKEAKWTKPNPDGDITVEATVTDVKEES